jgi:hypothetical protein
LVRISVKFGEVGVSSRGEAVVAEGEAGCWSITVDGGGSGTRAPVEKLGDGNVTLDFDGVSPNFEMPKRISPQSSQYRFFIEEPPRHIADG